MRGVLEAVAIGMVVVVARVVIGACTQVSMEGETR